MGRIIEIYAGEARFLVSGIAGFVRYVAAVSENLLGGEKSPYLLQHKDNPVAWQPWGQVAFDAAQRENKPVFLSIGYSTCHWCHVMAHESFENPAIAVLMNEDFINIKVDREERPDVDRLYMAYVQATTGGGGWPMSVWLTPDGKPFFGGTYFPPEDRYGRAGFPNVLGQIAQIWRQSPARVEAEGQRVMAALAQSSDEARTEFASDAEPLVRGAEKFAASFDEEEGGFGNAPKFPRPSVLNFLLRQEANPGAREMALFTLTKMAMGGIRDHLGGGFHRYSVDAHWHVPHFEKMLYDQAQLAVSYLEAWQITQEEAYADIAREICDYVLREMTHPEGGFFSAEDADSLLAHGSIEHAEGAFYVWTQEEIFALLGEEIGIHFCEHYGVEEAGNARPGSDPQGEFVGKNILCERLGAGRDEVLAAARLKLFAERTKRPRPHLDDKVLTAWNGLMISTLAQAGAALDEPRYLAAAQKAARFLQSNLIAEGRLLRSWREGASEIDGFAEDYAFLIRGLIDLYEADFDEGWLRWAEELQQTQDELFWDEAGGSYFSSAAGDPLMPVRMKDDYDGAEPAANSISALNLLRMAQALNESALTGRAQRILAAYQTQLEQLPTGVPQMLVALDLALAPHAQAVVAGDREEARRWGVALHRQFHPRRALLRADEWLSEKNPLLAEMRPVGGKTALYLCENFTCQAPLTDPAELT